MFKIRMLPAGYGDCLWIEYGAPEKPYRFLIDAGTLSTYKEISKRVKEDLKPEERRFELFIVSHIDTDHIDAAVKLLNSRSLKLKYDQIWFNGWDQLLDKDLLGTQQGEFLSALIKRDRLLLNTSFQGGAVFVPDTGKLPECKLPGGMKLTLLSPDMEQLKRLRADWRKSMGEKAGDPETALARLTVTKKYKDELGEPDSLDVDALADAQTGADTAVANGSSIAVLAEYEGKRCLFAADAYPDVLERAIARLLHESGSERLRLDVLKVPHHGSKHNITASLCKKLNCRRYLISTNGKIFKHPHPEGIARIIKYGGPTSELYFNYNTEYTRIWNDPTLKRKYRYEVVIREETAATLDIDV